MSYLEPFKTEVREEVAKTIIATNGSPDIAFDRSINPYRGCEHGCVYCYARPSHAYWGYSAGLDFETKLTAKVNAVEALEQELSRPGYSPATIMIGSNTDGYQPIERERKITRGVLEALDRFNHPVAIVTKSALVIRDIDILSRLASRGLTRVAISVTTLDHRLARKMEPRASTPAKRIEAIRRLSAAGVPVAVMAAPLIPALNDSELERILQAAAAAGATEAAYVLLRLPLEIARSFRNGSPPSFRAAPSISCRLCAQCAGARITFPALESVSAELGTMRIRSRRASSWRSSDMASIRDISVCAAIFSASRGARSSPCSDRQTPPSAAPH